MIQSREFSLVTKGRLLKSGHRVKKGEMIDIPISALNRDESLWGEDAKEYRCVQSFDLCPVL